MSQVDQERLYKRSNDVQQTLISFDNQQEPITNQNWTEILHKYRLLLAQVNKLHDDLHSDDTMKQYAVFPNQDKFRENPDRLPNLLSVFTHDQVSAIPLAPEDILPIEQVHQIVKTHNENSARLLQNYKEITTITTAPTSSSNRRAKRDKPKTSLIAIKSRDMLPKEMKAQDQLRLQQQDPAKYQAFTDSAAKNNHLLAGLMFGKNVKVDKPKKLPSKNQQSSNADANAPEEDKTSRAYFVQHFQKQLKSTTTPEFQFAMPQIPPKQSVKEESKAPPTSTTIDQKISKKLLVKNKQEPKEAKQEPKAQSTQLIMGGRRGAITSETKPNGAKQTPNAGRSSPSLLQQTGTASPPTIQTPAVSGVTRQPPVRSTPSPSSLTVPSTNSGTTTPTNLTATTPSNSRPTIVGGAARYAPYTAASNPLLNLQAGRGTTKAGAIDLSGTPTNMGPQSQIFGIPGTRTPTNTPTPTESIDLTNTATTPQATANAIMNANLRKQLLQKQPASVQQQQQQQVLLQRAGQMTYPMSNVPAQQIPMMFGQNPRSVQAVAAANQLRMNGNQFVRTANPAAQYPLAMYNQGMVQPPMMYATNRAFPMGAINAQHMLQLQQAQAQVQAAALKNKQQQQQQQQQQQKK